MMKGEIFLSWNELKDKLFNKNLYLQFVEYEHYYKVFTVEDGIMYSCTILKDINFLSQSPEYDWESEKIDFETNYKSEANKPVIPRDKNGRPFFRAESRPLNSTTVFVGRADSDNNIGDGKVLSWDFSNNDDIVTEGIPEGYKRKRLEFKFLDPIHIKEGAIYYFNVLKGSYIDFMVVCPAGQYYYDNNGELKQATEDTVISHYVVHHSIQGSIPMGDELNTESCSEEIPNYYKFWIEITVPEEDNQSNGYITMEIYRQRTVIL